MVTVSKYKVLISMFASFVIGCAITGTYLLIHETNTCEYLSIAQLKHIVHIKEYKELE